MSNEVLLEALKQISISAKRILKRFEQVDSVDYFLDSEDGLEKMDALCMQLIAIGESLKNVDKLTEKKLLAKYPDINWRAAKGIRDIITHHYFDLDAESIYDVCENNIEPLLKTIDTIIEDIS
ncbi:MAG TPA: DUF86 domain-containing protein [Sulfurospirillum arcachonense]|nr:DUF86 domain-containing protein [Arcobacter sp.]HIP45679.1 DUF86 domain-containing protein [Sulfurospirillum arcachonense]